MQFETNARGGWIVPANTSIPANTVIPAWSELGNSCTIGNDCALGAYCKLGNGCKLGAYCKLGNSCMLGNRCTLGDDCMLGNDTQWMGVTVQSWLTLSNVDGSGRQVKVVKHGGGVHVEVGCFQGTLEEFCAKAAGEGKDRYVRVVSAVAATM